MHLQKYAPHEKINESYSVNYVSYVGWMIGGLVVKLSGFCGSLVEALKTNYHENSGC